MKILLKSLKYNTFNSAYYIKFFSSYTKNNYVINLKPHIKYHNADVDKIKIFIDNRNKIGIYRWINNFNGNTYI